MCPFGHVGKMTHKQLMELGKLFLHCTRCGRKIRECNIVHTCMGCKEPEPNLPWYKTPEKIIAAHEKAKTKICQDCFVTARFYF